MSRQEAAFEAAFRSLPIGRAQNAGTALARILGVALGDPIRGPGPLARAIPMVTSPIAGYLEPRRRPTPTRPLTPGSLRQVSKVLPSPAQAVSVAPAVAKPARRASPAVQPYRPAPKPKSQSTKTSRRRVL